MVKNCVSAVKRTEVFAGTVIGAFFVHSKCVPSSRTEDIFFFHVVHADGDAEHRAESDDICTDMTIGDRSVVGAPAIHDIVSGFKSTFTSDSGGEPGARPSVVGAFPECI